MMARNDVGKRWVNGTLGRVAHVEAERVQVDIDGALHLVDAVQWENIRYQYDANDNLIAVTDPAGNVTRNVFDAANRLILTVGPTGAVTQNTFDANGNLTKTTRYATAINPAAPNIAASIKPSASDQTDHRVFDKNNRLIATVNALGEVTRHTLDANGNATEITRYANRINLAISTTYKQ